jgi:hypothetical protein
VNVDVPLASGGPSTISSSTGDDGGGVYVVCAGTYHDDPSTNYSNNDPNHTLFEVC